METPSFTESQALLAASSSRKFDESEKNLSKSTQKSVKNQNQDRSALFDITNDSPIVGLAVGSLKTPSSAVSKRRINVQGLFARTPGSGEALLRGQVKTLLQKVEEEAELSKILLENRPLFNLQGVNNSPINFVAPTPTNTPEIFNLSANGDGLSSVTPSMERFVIPKMLNEMNDEKKQGSIECESMITRTLLFDFSDKSESSSDCSSVLTCLYEERESSREKKVSTDDDDDASLWSMQVNASSTRDEEEDEEEAESSTEEVEEYYEEEEHGFGDNGWLLDDVCEGMSKISVKDGPKFEGKHIRFVYKSDGEIEEEEEVCGIECETPIDDVKKNRSFS